MHFHLHFDIYKQPQIELNIQFYFPFDLHLHALKMRFHRKYIVDFFYIEIAEASKSTK